MVRIEIFRGYPYDSTVVPSKYTLTATSYDLQPLRGPSIRVLRMLVIGDHNSPIVLTDSAIPTVTQGIDPRPCLVHGIVYK
jgi:hypothetical protein